MTIKKAKAYFLRRNTEAFDSVYKQAGELNDLMAPFANKGGAAHEEQTEVVASGILERIKEDYNAVTKALAMYYDDCSDPLCMPVSKQQRRTLKDARAPFRIAFCAIRAAYRDGTINGGDTALQLVARCDVMRKSMKTFRDTLRVLKSGISRHIQSIAFTNIINRDALISKYSIGQGMEGSAEEANGDASDCSQMVANDAPIEYDTHALTDDQLALKEARNLMRRTASDGDAAESSDQDAGNEHEKTSRELSRLAARAHNVTYRGAEGVMETRTLRNRSERQRDRMRAVVEFDASSDRESYDGAVQRKPPTAAAINSESSDHSFNASGGECDSSEGTYDESGSSDSSASDESRAPKRRRLQKRASMELLVVRSDAEESSTCMHASTARTLEISSESDSLAALIVVRRSDAEESSTHEHARKLEISSESDSLAALFAD